MDTLPDFVAQILVHEGAWVIEPQRRDDSLARYLLNRLRTAPARISTPRGGSRYAFAERGAKGKWFFVWVPDR